MKAAGGLHLVFWEREEVDVETEMHGVVQYDNLMYSVVGGGEGYRNCLFERSVYLGFSV